MYSNVRPHNQSMYVYVTSHSTYYADQKNLMIIYHSGDAAPEAITIVQQCYHDSTVL